MNGRPGRMGSAWQWALGVALAAWAAAAGELSADEILSRVDDTLYAPKDKKMTATFVLIDKNGTERARKLEVLERGAEHRLMKFTEPADQKGIAFLSLPGDIMYLYLPAFGKERRIASHVKNTSFAGTDLTFENLEPKRYSSLWQPRLIGSDSVYHVLELTPRPGTQSEYSRLVVKVRRDNFFPMHVTYYDKAGKHCKTFVREKVVKIGAYWEATSSVMEDVRKQHKTRLLLDNVVHDSNIPDECFTVRYLSR